MNVFVRLDMHRINEARKVDEPPPEPEEEGKKKKQKKAVVAKPKDPTADTLKAIRQAGFKPKKHQGTLFTNWALIRGEVADEAVILKIRKIPFVLYARKIC